MDRQEIVLAICPFENLSLGKELDILCRSFHLDLVAELSRFRQFHIVSFDTVAGSGALPQDPLWEEVRPDYLVKGSFRASRETIRINAQLIHCPSLRVIWADRIGGSSQEIFDIQEDLLRKLSASFQTQLNYNLLSLVRKKPTTSLKAYENWLYGYYELKKGTVESDLKAREYFRNAIAQDPGYSLAYSGMSLSYFNEWSCQLWDRWDLSQNGAFEWAEKAIALDEQNYVAAYVLGRLLIYKHAFETAEQLVRKSLSLNSSDPESLINIALCFIYLGYLDEAWSLYERAQRLSPGGNVLAVGAVILIERGKFKEGLALGEGIEKPPYTDTYAYLAAAWYHLGNEEKMREYWNKFLQSFSTAIKGGTEAGTDEAIQWLQNVNPFKGPSKVEALWQYLSRREPGSKSGSAEARTTGNGGRNALLKQNDYWECEFGNEKFILPEVKGFYDLKKLLAAPNSPFHSAELMGIPLGQKGEKVFDEKAKKAYQQRIRELQEEIREADTNNDFSTLYKLQDEYDRLIDHLSKSLNIKRQTREKGNPAEKARAAVTWRIRHAIAKIEEVHPPMGRHLANSVKTGTFCIYEPEKETRWEL